VDRSRDIVVGVDEADMLLVRHRGQQHPDDHGFALPAPHDPVLDHQFETGTGESGSHRRVVLVHGNRRSPCDSAEAFQQFDLDGVAVNGLALGSGHQDDQTVMGDSGEHPLDHLAPLVLGRHDDRHPCSRWRSSPLP
jgi:hypothetical protein